MNETCRNNFLKCLQERIDVLKNTIEHKEKLIAQGSHCKDMFERDILRYGEEIYFLESSIEHFKFLERMSELMEDEKEPIPRPAAR